MVTIKEGARPQQFILSEAEGQRSRDNITLAGDQEFAAGTVLVGSGVGDAKTYAVWASGAGDLAIANYGAKTETAGAGVEPTRISAITRDAEVNRHAMSWPDGFDDTDVALAAAELAKQGIIVRGVSMDDMGGLPASPGAASAPASP